MTDNVFHTKTIEEQKKVKMPLISIKINANYVNNLIIATWINSGS